MHTAGTLARRRRMREHRHHGSCRRHHLDGRPAGLFGTPLVGTEDLARRGQRSLDLRHESRSCPVSYEQTQGNVALRALLTDGSAFCAFLQGGAGIDNAMVSVAWEQEAKRHRPTFLRRSPRSTPWRRCHFSPSAPPTRGCCQRRTERRSAISVMPSPSNPADPYDPGKDPRTQPGKGTPSSHGTVHDLVAQMILGPNLAAIRGE